MKSAKSNLASLKYFRDGDPILESSRLELYSSNGTIQPLSSEAKTKKGEDYKWLRKGLSFLKFSPDEVDDIVGLVDDIAGIAAGAATAIGAVSTAIELAKKFGILERSPSQEEMIEYFS